MAQIRCSKLSIGYNIPIVSGLSFELNAGDYLCIVGENGAGKSTLMKTILGLVPALKGNIKFYSHLTRKDIGYLPQQSVVQKDFPATCMEVVMSGFQNRCGFRPFYKKSEKKEALSYLERLGITDLQNKCYRELSGGQQQRVLLARALCSTSKMILLDEPVAGLDPIATEEMYEIIKGLNDDGISIIMISHDIDSALKYATHILYVCKEPFFGTKQEFLETEKGKKMARYTHANKEDKNNEWVFWNIRFLFFIFLC